MWRLGAAAAPLHEIPEGDPLESPSAGLVDCGQQAAKEEGPPKVAGLRPNDILPGCRRADQLGLTYAEHLGPAYRTGTLSCRSTILEGDLLSIVHVSPGATL